MKSVYWKHLLSLTALLALLLTACGAASPSESPSDSADAESPAAEAETSTVAEESASPSGACANEYFPVAEGASWVYASSSSVGAQTWTMTVTEVNEDNFTMTQVFEEDLSLAQKWTCDENGITALKFGAGPEAALSTSGLEISYETVDVNGVTFPAHIEAGDTWQQTFTVEGGMTVSEGMDVSVAGNVAMNYSAVGIEEVTVPAGTFNAMKLQIEMQFDFQASVAGVGMPMSFTSSEVMWLAPNTGWVKADADAQLEGVDASSLVELQSYSMP